jgi:ferritin-like metal-binding protein YciE
MRWPYLPSCENEAETTGRCTDKSASDEASNAIDGLLAECMEAIAKFKDTTALDASIIAGVQAVAL